MNNKHTLGFDSRVFAVKWQDDHLLLLDQRRLPEVIDYLQLESTEEVANAISDMVVRGAPAIGITAAYGVVIAAREAFEHANEDWRQAIQPHLEKLKHARPTAVNLAWAIEQMIEKFPQGHGSPVEALLREARKIHQEDIDNNHRIGDFGAALIEHGNSVLTHCNAGALATGGYGTALGVLRSAWSDGKLNSIYAGETRPWLQGARLTAWELLQDTIPVTLISDTAAAWLFAEGYVNWVVVGADRIAANGDVANKIGTSQLAICARYYGVRFMVAAPLSTFDMASKCGADIPIEMRSEQEVRQFSGEQVAADGAAALNPAFDITKASLIDAIVTEKGVIESPDRRKISKLFQAPN